jgi:hypothetical protein
MPPRTKANAAANEAEDVAKIVKHMNDDTPAGKKIKAAFKDKFGLDILEARNRNGSRKTHYDLSILVGKDWSRVEHKGSATLTEIKVGEVPWAAGVQFYNGGCEKYEVTRAYARLWYDTYIGSGTLKATWKIDAPIPSFEEWLKGDCCQQGNPKTQFGKQLKEKVRALREGGSLLDERKEIVKNLVINEEALKRDVSKLANEVLDKKDYWMEVRGNIDGEFNVAWHPKYMITDIETIDIIRDLDIKIVFNCAGGMSFNGILRWGKGAGFSCLRLDLK